MLVEKGLYKSFESFLEIAAFNQLAMERVRPAEIVERGHRKMRGAVFPPENGVHEVQKSKAAAETVIKASRTATIRSVVEPVARVATPDDVRVTEADYEIAFKRLALVARTYGPKPIAPTTDKLSQERLFGQVNRLLPLKLACRWLLNLVATEGRWPRYEIISDKLADDAGTIGTLLEKWDADNERKCDELLSTGLPRRGNSASRDRFLSQFLAGSPVAGRSTRRPSANTNSPGSTTCHRADRPWASLLLSGESNPRQAGHEGEGDAGAGGVSLPVRADPRMGARRVR